MLGKLFDDTLEPYLASLAERFVPVAQLSQHLLQTAYALDNLELLPELSRLEDHHDIAALRRVLSEHLRMRTTR